GGPAAGPVGGGGGNPLPIGHGGPGGAPGGAAAGVRQGGRPPRAATPARRYRVWTVPDPRRRRDDARPGGGRSFRRAPSGPPRPLHMPRIAPQSARSIWSYRVLPSHSLSP